MHLKLKEHHTNSEYSIRRQGNRVLEGILLDFLLRKYSEKLIIIS
jgi:hypothetical protein